eukprot:evm.model.scf_2464.2 EVM.evm.TU.scf_2464.2   scf_2464:14595-23270(-)
MCLVLAMLMECDLRICGSQACLHLQDPDVGVQETAADVLGYLAANIVDFSGGLLSGDSTNVIVRNIFEALQDPKKDAQLAASTALLRVAPSVGPMSKDYVKELLRCFKSNGFHAKSVLVSALAGWDAEAGFPRGLFKNSTPSFKPYMNHIMGNPASTSTSGNGLLSFLSSTEWPLRKACADALKSVVVVLGPEVDEQRGGMEGQKLSSRIRKALNQYRFDKVKPARDSILEALQAVHILQKYQVPEQSEEWLDFYLEEAAKMPATGVGSSQNGRISPGFSRRSAVDPNSDIFESFKKAAAEEDVVATPLNSPPQMASPEPESPSPRSVEILEEDMVEMGSPNGDVDDQAECLPECQGSMQDRMMWAAEGHMSIVAERLETLEQQQGQLFDMVSGLSNKIDSSVIGLQSEVTFLQQMVADFQDHMNAMGEGIRRAITPEMGVGRTPSTSPPPPQMAQDMPASHVPTRNVRSSCSTPSAQNLDAAYSEAMSCPNNDLMLLRLLQRTGPILPELSPNTINRLLRWFQQLLSEGTAVSRILPWLWQLAEPENAAACAQHVPEDMKEKLIEVIGLLSLEATDHQTTEQLKSLESRLLSCWSQGNPMVYGAAASLQMASMNGGSLRPVKTRAPAPAYPAPGVQSTQSWLQSSAEGLDALKAQFSGLEIRQAQR